MDFQKQKLDELFMHDKDSSGKQPNIAKLRQRVQYIIKILREDRLGMAPFYFKKGGDFWPDMPANHMKVYGEEKLEYFKAKERKLQKYTEACEAEFN